MADAQTQFSGTRPVAPQHAFDVARLAAFMRQHVQGFEGELAVEQFKGGQSNPTFLLADVDVVAEYRLYNINRTKLEGLIHRALGPARLDLSAGDRFGKTVQPREWFLVPLSAIDELVAKISDGSVTDFHYDPEQAQFVPDVT